MTLAQNILKRLEEVYPNSLPTNTLLAGVNLNSPAPVVPSALKRELETLSGLEVVQVEDPDRGTLFTITARGRARIANL